MNPYPARIAELHDFLAEKYAMRDTQAADLLLISLMYIDIDMRYEGLGPRTENRGRVTRPWFIVETDYPSRDTKYAWFSLGGEEVVARSLAVQRLSRLQKCEEVISSWLEERDAGGPAILTDSEWRRLLVIEQPLARYEGHMPIGWRTIASNAYRLLLSTCLRLRVEHPRGPAALRGADETEANRIELARLVRRVLDNGMRTGTEGRGPRSAPMDADLESRFLYWCELLQRVAPAQSDWEALTGGLAAVGRGTAILYNEDREFDRIAVQRVMRDSIPYLTEWVLRTAAMPSDPAARRAWGVKRYEEETFGPNKALQAEVKRLQRNGVIRAIEGMRRGGRAYLYHPWRYEIADVDFKRLIDRSAEIL